MTQPNKTMKIGLWGGERTGKTVYLAMLYLELLKNHQRWYVQTQDSATRQFIKMAREHLLDGHKFPDKTAMHNIYAYEVLDRETQRQFRLEFMDVPGELADTYYDEKLRNRLPKVEQSAVNDRRASLTPQALFDHLTTCDGILIFLDPERFEESASHTRYSYRQMLTEFLEDLRDYRYRTTDANAPYLALCMTKVDAKGEYWQHYQSTRDHHEENCQTCSPDCIIHQKLTPLFMQTLPSLHPIERVGCFLISSVGRLEKNANEPLTSNTTQADIWESNVSNAVVWERLETPRPWFINDHQHTALSDTLQAFESTYPNDDTSNNLLLSTPTKDNHLAHEFPPDDTGYPASLRRDPQPINLIQPIEWLMDCLIPREQSPKKAPIITEQVSQNYEDLS